MFDLAIIESNGNGGDLQLLGNDLAVVNQIENMPYLALFGGNTEQSTGDPAINNENFDYWANALLMPDKSQQFNSSFERSLNTIPLTSEGRVLLENSIKNDLKFFINVDVAVVVTIVSVDTINVNVSIDQPPPGKKIFSVTFKKSDDGDWFFFDFNTDFNT